MVRQDTEQFLTKIMASYDSEYPKSHGIQIEKAWEMICSKEYLEALRFLLICQSHQTIFSSDPIFISLCMRSAMGVFESKEANEGAKSAASCTMQSCPIDLALTISLIESGIEKQFGGNLPDEIKEVYPNLLCMFQFALFQYIKLMKDSPKDEWNEESMRLWKQYCFDEFYDYSGVDPFILDLCPPYCTWKRYVIDEFVFERDGERLKQIPIALYDFSANPLGEVVSS